MTVGQKVTLVDHGQEKSALILNVGESGASGFKTLALGWYDDGAHAANDVVHERDAGRHVRFWREGNPRQNQTGEPAIAAPIEEPAGPKKASSSKK